MNAIWNAFIHNRAYINDMTSEEVGRTVKAVFSRLASENSTIELGTKETDVVDAICKEILSSNAPTTGNDFEFHAELVVRLTQQDVDDIMVSALEGGINYWCRSVVVEGNYLGEYASDQISRGGQLTFWLHEPLDDSMASYTLDLDKFLAGFKRWLENCYANCDVVDSTDGSVDCGQIDATCADEIVQYALFGDLVFG